MPNPDLDAELAQLLSDPASIGYSPLPGRRVRTPRVRRRRSLQLPSPIFLGIVALTIAGGIVAATQQYMSTTARVGIFVFIVAAWLFSVCLHEFAHALAAHYGGDHGVAESGYLRLNPFRYTHPLFSVILPLFWIAYGGIGLPGAAVMIHRHRLTRRWASVMSAVGPLVNVVLALLTVAALQLFTGGAKYGATGFGLYAALGFFAWLQVAAAILNLLPIPGLDGWDIIEPWVSSSTAHRASKLAPFGLLLVVAVLITPAGSAQFSHLVTHIALWLGVPPRLPGIGSSLFRFWRPW